ncbi:MAG: hypothetical protein KKH29_00025 [Candidatus Omnitrophica bacterium]|nr:hypothetical protein [Candidatus Omnitrophota bacterium]MBU4473171.1 hypothetical protein [Candidatus Omnitrophota bacterium]MCG2706458.1 hypothetical protein [Candidatus Omnitrophota bacterium]
MPKDNYCLEFILYIQNNTSIETLRESITECGENLEIYQLPQDNPTKGKEFRICIHTQDPTIIFDTCAQFGRLKSVKIK